MADGKHLGILKSGVGEWNKWRDHNPLVKPDLSLAQLSGKKLEVANFSDTDFRGANLSYAKLSLANMERANFVGTNLLWANLVEANLSRAVLRKSYINNLDITLSILYETIFADVDLSNINGLNYCIFRGPSVLDHRTLLKSVNIPESFLKGCGLPDLLINMYQNDLNRKIRYPSCFISYSVKDQSFADRLYRDLQANGVRCWFAPHDMKGGQKVHEQIEYAIQKHDRLLLILSDNSMNSEWVRTEIFNARVREVHENTRVLFPVRLVEFDKIRNWKCFDVDTGKDSAREIREYYIPGFENWNEINCYTSAFSRLLEDLAQKEV